MIITRTPVRVSFLGGGTDYPLHFREHGGRTLGAAIDKYSYIMVSRLAPLFEYKIRVGYSRTELVNSVDQVEHPSVRECLRFLGIESGVEIDYVGDLPARTGLGSSSSFTVGLLHALHALKGQLVGRDQLAAEAVLVEQDLMHERVGVQDQYTCALGGLLSLEFSRDGSVAATPVPMERKRRESMQTHLMLYYTGIVRHAHEILAEQMDRTRAGENHTDLNYLSELVRQGLEIMTSDGPLAPFGEVLHSAWLAKRRLSSKVSNAKIDSYYEAARQSGAIGGKLLGAGGGGFMLLFVPPEAQQNVNRALGDLARVPFSIEDGGSRLLLYEA